MAIKLINDQIALLLQFSLIAVWILAVYVGFETPLVEKMNAFLSVTSGSVSAKSSRGL